MQAGGGLPIGHCPVTMNAATGASGMILGGTKGKSSSDGPDANSGDDRMNSSSSADDHRDDDEQDETESRQQNKLQTAVRESHI